MAIYPIKMLKDEAGTPFVPLVAPEAVIDNNAETLTEKLENINDSIAELMPNVLTDLQPGQVALAASTYAVGGTITINKDGKYLLLSSLDITADSAGNIYSRLGINGSAIDLTVRSFTNVLRANMNNIYVADLIANDIVRVEGYSTTGGSMARRALIAIKID